MSPCPDRVISLHLRVFALINVVPKREEVCLISRSSVNLGKAFHPWHHGHVQGVLMSEVIQ